MEKQREKQVGVLYYGGGLLFFFRELAYFIAGGLKSHVDIIL